jgi:hypothetical protein
LWSTTTISGLFKLLAGSDAPFGRYVSDLGVARDNNDLLYVSYDDLRVGNLWRCETKTDQLGVRTYQWFQMSGSPPHELPAGPVFTIEIEPESRSTIYAGTEDGVYRTRDGGLSWNAFNEGLPHTTVYDLKRHPKLPLLRAATHGRGVWERDVSGASCQDTDLYVRDNVLDYGRSLSYEGGFRTGQIKSSPSFAAKVHAPYSSIRSADINEV